jgi:hypothetical protein
MEDHQPIEKAERGQSIIEFAVGLVVLIILLSGIVDAGRALFTYMALREAAQEGALYGSTNPTETNSIEDRAMNSSSLVSELASTPDNGLHHVQHEAIDVQVSIIGAACSGNGIRVQVSYNQFPITMPFLGTILGRQDIPISASATDTILTPSCP